MADQHTAANGLVQVTLYDDVVTYTGAEHTALSIFPSQPDSDEIIIGGGVLGSEDPGKLITASYPRADLKAWQVSVKDHLAADVSAGTTGYALALRFFYRDKVTPISRQQVMRFVHLTSSTSAVTELPGAIAPAWPGCDVVGGGFQVNAPEPGSLGTASFYTEDAKYNETVTNGWAAAAKSHLASCPASITAYCISVASPFGPLVEPDGSVYQYELNAGPGPTVKSAVSNHPSDQTFILPSRSLTGGGAQVLWQETGGPGNLLWKLRPIVDPHQGWGFEGGSKDHLVADPCAIAVQALGIDPFVIDWP